LQELYIIIFDEINAICRQRGNQAAALSQACGALRCLLAAHDSCVVSSLQELHIIIFDEIDAICRQRGNKAAAFFQTVVPHVLSCCSCFLWCAKHAGAAHHL
jgi:SpoVK/Ycf46/Vps4 family AAA+-type ATPase